MIKTSLRFLTLSVILFSVVLLPIFSSCSCSDDSDGTILSLSKGDVSVMKSGNVESSPAESGMLLSKGDIIYTGADGTATIMFFDGSIIELKTNTRVEISELIEGKDKEIRLKQDIGYTISKIENMADSSSRYEIETPAAVAGVRGSQMMVNVDEDGMTAVANLEGEIYVRAQGIEVSIPVGNYSTVKSGEVPSEPQPLSEETPDNLVSDPAGDVFDSNLDIITGYDYLDITGLWLENGVDDFLDAKGGAWRFNFQVNGIIPDTVEMPGVVEYDVMVDADNDINTGWTGEALFNDLGIDYYFYVSNAGEQWSAGVQKIIETTGLYENSCSSGVSENTLYLSFDGASVSYATDFSYVILARYYAIIGDGNSLVAADKMPADGHFSINNTGEK